MRPNYFIFKGYLKRGGGRGLQGTPSGSATDMQLSDGLAQICLTFKILSREILTLVLYLNSALNGPYLLGMLIIDLFFPFNNAV